MRLTQYTFNDIVLLLQYFNARWPVYIGVKYPILSIFFTDYIISCLIDQDVHSEPMMKMVYKVINITVRVGNVSVDRDPRRSL